MKTNKLFSLHLLAYLIISFSIFTISGCNSPEKMENPAEVGQDKSEYRDLLSDTWVATDALGRAMPTNEEVGAIKDDQRRVAGIFYITWHTQDKTQMEQPYRADVTKILNEDPSTRFDANHVLWYTNSYHWGEPEMGYFLNQDKWVIRKDMSMLTDAGIDVLIMDVTNAVRYWDEWDVIFNEMLEMKAEGNEVPKFCFWAFNGPVITVVQDLYEKVYEEEKYKDLWFFWDDKPLLLYNDKPGFDANTTDIKHPNPNYDPAAKTDVTHPHYQDPNYSEEFYKDYTKEVKDFFTLRTMWWGYYEWGGEMFVGTEDNWSFGYNLADPRVKSMKPEELLSTHKGKREQVAVTAAQHPVTMAEGEKIGVGKSWSRENGQPALNEYDLADRAYVPWLGDTVDNPVDYGIYFQERWDEAIEANPEFLYINDWNEWTAGKYHPTPEGGISPKVTGLSMSWLGRENPFIFVDQYNSEFNRCIHPMKGGYTDNYYMQMAQNMRRYKGARPIPVHEGFDRIKIDGNFSDWEGIEDNFRDTRGDTFHRDALGYAGIHYVDTSGRNDIITAKVSVDKKQINFYAETSEDLTSHTGENWMLLLIDGDKNSETGWYGYDFLINKSIADQTNTSIMGYEKDNLVNPWTEIACLPYQYSGNKLELSVPRELLELTNNEVTFDFKWIDNPEELKDPISLCTKGDAAPNRRFNYRFIWNR